MTIDPYLFVRGITLYIAAVSAAIVWAWRRPSAQTAAGSLLASAWNLVALLGLHVMANQRGWWHFEATGGLLLGMPVDLYLSWAVLWGVVPALAFPSASLILVAVGALAIDLVLMPAASPTIQLGSSWLIGECAGLACCFVPGQLLARWTTRDERLSARAVLQVAAFSGLLVFVLPAIAIDASNTREARSASPFNPFTLPLWQVSLLAQALAFPAVLGLTAVQEFVTRGLGTPVPFDPPRRLVTTGVYAYVRNPMQLSAVVLLVVLGAILQSVWVAAAGLVAHIYSIGLAGWDEESDLRLRFGDAWISYRQGVRRWIPRFRPWHPPERSFARLYVGERCGMCHEVGLWFQRRRPQHLEILPAELHPSGTLMRITYEPNDGSPAVSGVDAVARALEHVHLGWAALGFVLRLPVLSSLLQLLADASGAEPRMISARERSAPAGRSERRSRSRPTSPCETPPVETSLR